MLSKTKAFLEISQNLQENTCTRVSILTKLQALPVLSCEFSEISKNTFFTEYIWATAFTNNKKLDKETQETEEIQRLSMERFSETQERRSNDDDVDVTSPKQKKSRISGTDTIAYLREKTKKDFELRAEKFKLKRESS